MIEDAKTSYDYGLNEQVQNKYERLKEEARKELIEAYKKIPGFVPPPD
jgi:hypothetical protein